MSKLKENKKTCNGESDFHYSKNIICCKLYDKKPFLPLAANVDGMTGVSHVMRQIKGSATKTHVSCPSIIKFYSNDMGGLDIMDQKKAAYRLDRKSKYCV